MCRRLLVDQVQLAGHLRCPVRVVTDGFVTIPQQFLHDRLACHAVVGLVDMYAKYVNDTLFHHARSVGVFHTKWFHSKLIELIVEALMRTSNSISQQINKNNVSTLNFLRIEIYH